MLTIEKNERNFEKLLYWKARIYVGGCTEG